MPTQHHRTSEVIMEDTSTPVMARCRSFGRIGKGEGRSHAVWAVVWTFLLLAVLPTIPMAHAQTVSIFWTKSDNLFGSDLGPIGGVLVNSGGWSGVEISANDSAIYWTNDGNLFRSGFDTITAELVDSGGWTDVKIAVNNSEIFWTNEGNLFRSGLGSIVAVQADSGGWTDVEIAANNNERFFFWTKGDNLFGSGLGAVEGVLVDSGGWSGVEIAANSSNLILPVILFELSVTINGSGNGAVTSSTVGVSCPGDCTEMYDNETPVTLTADSDAASDFVGWGGACAAQGTAPVCVVTMTQDQTVTATFQSEFSDIRWDVDGVDLDKVVCKNKTNGQKIRLDVNVPASGSCGDLGLVWNPGDNIQIKVVGTVVSVGQAGGVATGFDANLLVCKNRSTQPFLKERIENPSPLWDWADSGLPLAAGNRVQWKAKGLAN